MYVVKLTLVTCNTDGIDRNLEVNVRKGMNLDVFLADGTANNTCVPVECWLLLTKRKLGQPATRLPEPVYFWVQRVVRLAALG